MTDRALKFIHTADWQLGLRVRYIPGDAGAEVRNARLRTVKRIGEVARDVGAEFVVVAGDVFEHNGLKPSTLRKAFDILREYPVPVYLLPGNHDPYTPDSLYRSSVWERELPPGVEVLKSTDPVEVRPGVTLLPCPVLDRTSLDDPTAHLSADFGPQEGFRVGVAHGGIQEILAGMTDDGYQLSTAISLQTCARARLDYLALGDWHGCLPVNERTYYSGAPEATRFKEKDPGHVLVVEITEPGAKPEVDKVEVQSLRWRKLEEQMNTEEDLTGLVAQLEEIPDKADTLLEMVLVGAPDMPLMARLEQEVLEPATDRFRWLRPRLEGLHPVVDSEALDAMAGDGWLGAVVASLGAEGGRVADDAIRLLYRLDREVRR